MIYSYLPLLAQGTAMSIFSWIVSGTVSICLGTLLAVLSCKQLKLRSASRTVACYTFIAKGIPLYIQILIAYFVLPSLLGINLPPFIAGNLALAFCSCGYVTEIMRAGLNAVSKGQWQAAYVLGYSKPQTLKRIVLPQALQIMLPALFGEIEQLLKSSSLLATVGILELTRTGMNIISRELNPMPVYITIAAIYLLFSGLLAIMRQFIIRGCRYG